MNPPTGIGFGNYLYLWFDAYRRQRAGEDFRVLTHESMANWLSILPELRDDLTVQKDGLRFSDKRLDWSFQLSDRFGIDFTRASLQSFISRYLIGKFGTRDLAGEELVVNVRRGEYYTNPTFRGTYSFDIVSYLELALKEAGTAGEIQRVVVVSDDPEWCHIRLDSLFRTWAAEVEYTSRGEPPQEHFARVASAQRMIGTNSTFSYWGGYVSTVLYGSDSRVIMPLSHARLPGRPFAYQLDPHWTVIRDIPGGWDS